MNIIKRQMRLKCAITKLLKEGYSETEIINTVRSQSAKLEIPEIEAIYNDSTTVKIAKKNMNKNLSEITELMKKYNK